MTEGPVEPVEDKNPPADEVELVQADAGSDIETALTDEVAHAEPEESDEPRAEDADPVEPEAEEPVLRSRDRSMKRQRQSPMCHPPRRSIPMVQRMPTS